MQIVRCNACGVWIGDENKLEVKSDEECCPKCKNTETLMDVEHSCNFDDVELEKLWELFGCVAVNDNDEILEEFLGFSEGTDRIEVWHWFDEQHSKGVAYLANGKKSGKAVCRRCGTEVQTEEDKELRKEYPYYCPECDENMYSFECEEVAKE